MQRRSIESLPTSGQLGLTHDACEVRIGADDTTGTRSPPTEDPISIWQEPISLKRSIESLPASCQLGLTHEACEVIGTYDTTRSPSTEDPISIWQEPTRLEIRPKAHTPLDIEEDITDLFLACLRFPSLKSFEFLGHRGGDSNWYGFRYQFAPICEALKSHTSLESFVMIVIRCLEGQEDFLGGKSKVQNLLCDMLLQHNKTLQEIHLFEFHLGSRPERIQIFSTIFTQTGESYHGAEYDCWTATMRELNLNKLGRKKLGETTTTLAEFVAMIDPKKIWSRVDHSFPLWEEDGDDFGDELDYIMMSNTYSLRTLNHNYYYLRHWLEEWIGVVHYDVRAFNLLYGMLRESPHLWCRLDSAVDGQAPTI